jgi:hypothetical protein
MVGNPRNRMGARSELNSVFGLEKVDRWNPIRTSAIQSRSHAPNLLSCNGSATELQCPCVCLT